MYDNNVQLTNAKRIYEASKNNSLVILVGAGISNNSGIPTWSELIMALKKELPDEVKCENDALKVAQLYQNTYGKVSLTNKVKQILKSGTTRPNILHEAIFELQPCNIITTNYDDLLEQQSLSSQIPYSVIRQDKDIPYMKYNRSIIKMHGDFVSDNIVLTEDDYYNYQSNYTLISNLVQSLFASKTVLCVGYSFNDMDLKMILNTLRNILEKDTPQIFMLTDTSTNKVYEDYLKNKNIQTVWLQKNLINENNSESKKLSNPLGQSLYCQIANLSKEHLYYKDFIDDMYERLNGIVSELPYLGNNGLMHIIPQLYKRDYSHITGELNINSPQIKKIIKEINNRQGFRKFVKERIKKIHFLLEFAYNNDIRIIDSIDLTKFNYYKRLNKTYIDNSTDYFHEFNFSSLKQRLSEISHNSIEHNRSDLEKPYALWLLGRFTEAFKEYHILSKEYWKSSNYTLYAICRHSEKMLYNYVKYFSEKDTVFNELKEVEQHIDVKGILDNCILPESIHNILYDMTDYKMYLDTLAEAKDTEREILKDKIQSENGRWSFNHNIPKIISNVTDTYNFANINFIISNNKYAYEIYESALTGLLLAHKIQNEESSRLVFIPKDAVLLMIFHINPTDLKSIFYTYKITDIDLTPDAVKYLEKIISNISRDKEIILKMMLPNWFFSYFSNILYILLLSKNNFSNLNQLIEICTDNIIFTNITNDNLIILFNLLNKANATETQTNYLFNLYKTRQINIEGAICFDNNMIALTSYMADAKYKLTNPPTISEIMKNENMEEQLSTLSVLYPIVSEKTKEEIRKIVCSFDYLQFDKKCWRHLTNLCVSDFDITTNLLNAYMKANADDPIQKCYILSGIYHKTSNTEIKKKIGQYSEHNHALAFFIDPQTFDIKDFNLKWLNYINKEQLKMFLLKDNSSKLVKEYIAQASNFESKSIKDKLLACFT